LAFSTRAVVIAAVLIAVLVRVGWALLYTQSIENEGAEYGRIAENLLGGRGYVGMSNNGTQMGYPPLYPFLIAAVSYVLENTETAARVINVAFGAALVIPTFGIAKLLYGPRVARIVALVVALHPVLIAFGASTYSEGPYLTLLMFGLFSLMKYVSGGRLSATLWAGVCFGLAYLIRPEASLLVGMFTACGLVAAVWMRNRQWALRGPVTLAATFFLVALPYIFFLTLTTGTVRLEAKGPANFLTAQRLEAGMSLDEAGMGVNPDLSPQGVAMRPTQDVMRAVPSIRDYLTLFLTSAPHNAPALARGMVQTAFGSPVLLALVVVGLIGGGWNRRRMFLDGILLATLAVLLLLLLMIPPEMLWFRYFYPLVGILLIWGAKGADDLYEWCRTGVASITGSRPIAETIGALFKWGSIAALLAISLRITPSVDQFREGLFPEFARAGRWIARQSSSAPWIMDTTFQVPYYADGYFSPLPYASSDVTLQYIAKLKPDFIVLHGARRDGLPYTAQWFNDGIPDERAVLVYDDSATFASTDPPAKVGGAWEDAVKVYRWDPSR
jgi:4-amino-4-deoxy-L-arabinose transferase-like glycosyltransferase